MKKQTKELVIAKVADFYIDPIYEGTQPPLFYPIVYISIDPNHQQDTEIYILEYCPHASAIIDYYLHPPIDEYSEPYDWFDELADKIHNYMTSKGWELQIRREGVPHGVEIFTPTTSVYTSYTPPPPPSTQKPTTPNQDEIETILNEWKVSTKTKLSSFLKKNKKEIEELLVEMGEPPAEFEEDEFFEDEFEGEGFDERPRKISDVEVWVKTSVTVHVINHASQEKRFEVSNQIFGWKDKMKNWNKRNWLYAIVTLFTLLGLTDERIIMNFSHIVTSNPDAVALTVGVGTKELKFPSSSPYIHTMSRILEVMKEGIKK